MLLCIRNETHVHFLDKHTRMTPAQMHIILLRTFPHAQHTRTNNSRATACLRDQIVGQGATPLVPRHPR